MAGGHRYSLRRNVCRPATDAYTRIYNCKNIYSYINLKKYILCINICTPYVAATSFFTGEVEIFDFVTERVKRCIAAKRENVWGIFWEHTMMGEFKIWFEILVIYFISTALLIKINIPCTKKWAAGCDPPLHSGELTMMCRIICRKSYTRRENCKLRINYCKWIIVVCDYVVCSVGLRPDAWDIDKHTCISNIAI